jgi:hypothetical protein
MFRALTSGGQRLARAWCLLSRLLQTSIPIRQESGSGVGTAELPGRCLSLETEEFEEQVGRPQNDVIALRLGGVALCEIRATLRENSLRPLNPPGREHRATIVDS